MRLSAQLRAGKLSTAEKWARRDELLATPSTASILTTSGHVVNDRRCRFREVAVAAAGSGSKGRTRCEEAALPGAYHCRRHIACDRDQQLFLQCEGTVESSSTATVVQCPNAILPIRGEKLCDAHKKRLCQAALDRVAAPRQPASATLPRSEHEAGQ